MLAVYIIRGEHIFSAFRQRPDQIGAIGVDHREITIHFPVVAMCAQYGASVAPMHGRSGFYPGHGVEQTAYKQTPGAHSVGQIAVKHQQIVAEIKVCLPGIGSGKTASAEMIYG